MIREERDPAWWSSIAQDPDVAPWMGEGMDWRVVASPAVIPLAAEGGGYLFVKLDGLGRVLDLHAAFLPQSRGRLASAALKAALAWCGGWDVVLATEVSGNWRSRPPRSFGFRPSGPMSVGARTWILTRDGWDASPVRARME